MKVLEAGLEDLGLDVQVDLACLTLLEPAYTQIIQWARMFTLEDLGEVLADHHHIFVDIEVFVLSTTFERFRTWEKMENEDTVSPIWWGTWPQCAYASNA